MFETALLESAKSSSRRFTGRRRVAAVVAATVLEVMAVGGVVLVPLIRTEALDLRELQRRTRVYAPPPRSVRIVSVVRERGGATKLQARREPTLVLPTKIPQEILLTEEPPSVNAAGPDSLTGNLIPGSPGDGIPGGIDLGHSWTSPPPEPPVRKPMPVERRRVGGEVQAAKLIFAPKPEYPYIARSNRIQGAVRLEAIVGTDGSIQNLRVLSGRPLLVRAALEAVAQWRYQPTLLNGEPAEIQTEIVVNFILAE